MLQFNTSNTHIATSVNGEYKIGVLCIVSSLSGTEKGYDHVVSIELPSEDLTEENKTILANDIVDFIVFAQNYVKTHYSL